VWGRGATDPGFVRSWRGTANAQESGAALVSDTVLCLDEIGVAEARDAAAAVYQLATGIGKGRSHRDGMLREPMTWRVLTLSTGEIAMAAKGRRSARTARAGPMPGRR
jgi:putative DNA primase/helicase